MCKHSHMHLYKTQTWTTVAVDGIPISAISCTDELESVQKFATSVG